ncbi:MAG: DUF4339 domain-containing protein [Candidatus Syntrophonatronum acetioxidans]|uniref:DUF4339 domain-containing protein n=1 Tax=Candidatus Syntrophonatronum acetioxidans TaxID=1795816 RepID=A0A424YIZ6_9FIRM|nr:MAG: DUF4339 domain-containing protein [Candidatus Syntrophonatronum acetioxidans]
MNSSNPQIPLEEGKKLYNDALNKVSSLEETREKERRKPLLEEIVKTLTPVTARKLEDPDPFLSAQASSLQGIVELELAQEEKDPGKRSSLLRSGRALVARGIDEHSRGLPGKAAYYIPDNLAALAQAMQVASPEDKEEILGSYVEGFKEFIYSTGQVLHINREGVSLLLKAEVLLDAVDNMKDPSDRFKVIYKGLELTGEAINLFSFILDQEALDKALEVKEKFLRKLGQARTPEKKEVDGAKEKGHGEDPEPPAPGEDFQEPLPGDSPSKEKARQDTWYVSRSGEQFGPYTLDRLKEYIREGRVGEGDFLWYPGLDNWVTLEGARKIWQEGE